MLNLICINIRPSWQGLVFLKISWYLSVLRVDILDCMQVSDQSVGPLDIPKIYFFWSGFWWGYFRAGYFGWGVLQGQHIDHATSPWQSDTLDFWYHGLSLSLSLSSLSPPLCLYKLAVAQPMCASMQACI